MYILMTLVARKIFKICENSIKIYQSLLRLVIDGTHLKTFIAIDPVIVTGSIDDAFDMFNPAGIF